MGGADTSKLTTFSVRKPGSTLSKVAKLRMSKPAPTSNTTANAISVITSALRVRCAARRPLELRTLSLSICPISTPAEWNAGTSPNSRPVSTAIATEKASTRPSIATFSRRGKPLGPNATIASTIHAASAPPMIAPASERRTLSVTSWRTIRPRPAPSAVRTAISVSRPAARTSSRLATLAHAMRSTNVTAPNIVSSVPRTSPTSDRCSSSAVPPKFAFDFGNSCFSRAPTAAMSRFAAVSDTPGRRRAIAVMKCAPRFEGSLIHDSMTNGTQTSGVDG